MAVWQKLSKSYPPQFELIPLFLLFLNLYQILTSYPSLPDRIPAHFNFLGLPDRWGDKSSILVHLILGTFMYVLFTVINVLLAVARDPRKLINLPEKRKAALTDAQTEELRSFFNRSLFALKVLMQALLAYISYITIEVAMGRAGGLGIPFFFILGAMLLLAGYMVWQSFRLTTPRKTLQ